MTAGAVAAHLAAERRTMIGSAHRFARPRHVAVERVAPGEPSGDPTVDGARLRVADARVDIAVAVGLVVAGAAGGVAGVWAVHVAGLFRLFEPAL